MILKSMGVECKKDDMDGYAGEVDEEATGKFTFLQFCQVGIDHHPDGFGGDNDHDDDEDGNVDVGGTWGRSMNRPTASSTCFSSARLISMINDHNRHEDYAGDQQMIIDSQAFF